MLGQTDIRVQHFVKRGEENKTFMSDEQDEIRDIVAQLKRIQIEESILLQRLGELSETDGGHTQTDHQKSDTQEGTTRGFEIGDKVRIINPRPFQPKQGTIIKIGVSTDRLTVQSKNGTKIIRASSNLVHLE